MRRRERLKEGSPVLHRIRNEDSNYRSMVNLVCSEEMDAVITWDLETRKAEGGGQEWQLGWSRR